MNYPILFSPYKIGNVEMKNRAVMPAMGTNMADAGFVNQAIINHYVERAKGGMGLIIVEVTCVDAPLGKNTSNMLVIDDDKYIDGMKTLSDEIHKAGAKCFLQLSHTGRGARRAITGQQPVGPSAVAMPYSFMMGLGNEEPRELTIDEIKAIEDKYAAAAKRAKEAGFDGVEMHSCGYYLGEQFMSSTANIRTDEYGGNVENRCLFHRNIVTKIKALCGQDYPVVIKMPALELGESAGITIPDAVYYAKRFQDVGVDAIEVLAGKWDSEATIEDIPDTGSSKGAAIPLAAALKQGIMAMTQEPPKLALIGGGRSQDPQVAENALASYLCDFIFMGKGCIADPHIVQLIEEGRENEIRPCIGCGTCINEQLQGGKPAKCSGNAMIGNEDNDYSLEKVEIPKSVVVIGAGVGGVEAARIAAKRGHKVTLIEKSDFVGGQLVYVKAAPHKTNTDPLIPYLEAQLKVNNVDVRLGTEATAEMILAMNPDVVVCGTGVKPAKLPIPGFDQCLRAKDVLVGQPVGETVAIIGGGVVGCELAEYLGAQGKTVHIIEMLDTVAEKMVNVCRTILLGHLKHYGTNILTSSKCLKIAADHVVYMDKDGNEQRIDVDNVIESVGDAPETGLYASLEGKVAQLYKVGDCNAPESIAKAVYEGYSIGSKI